MIVLQIDPFVSELVKQGPVVALLVMAVLYFKKQNEKQEQARSELEGRIEAYLKEDRDKLTTLIANNTTVIQDNTRVMQEMANKLVTNGSK